MPSAESPRKTVTVIISGLLVAIVPAALGYMQNRDEIAARYAQTSSEAASGYQALATSVKELQASIVEQHDFIVKLQSQTSALELILQLELQQHFPQPHGTHVEAKTFTVPHIDPPAFSKLPASFEAAAKK